MKTWYLKLDVNNVIVDAIEYPFEGYIEVQLTDTQLPAGINGGWYTWNGTDYVENLALKPIPQSTEITLLKGQVAENQGAIDFIIMNF